MGQGCAAVLDVGKTVTKLSLWSPDGRLLDRRARANTPQSTSAYPALDAEGIAEWLAQELAAFARSETIAAIVPVAHGAAAVIVDDDGSYLPPMDYEAELPPALREGYLAQRDPYAVTGSPCLPAGLNLGAQLHWLDAIAPERARAGRIVTWPQFWAWLLSGVPSAEVSSLGSHTDLWCPMQGCPSPLAVARGWAERLAPLRHACDVLGRVAPAWRDRCTLPDDCTVLCGMHDSNAALLASRLYPEVQNGDFTVLSTGTWFVAMRALPHDRAADLSGLSETRDCLVNVDVHGTPVPSSRFMGGREVEIIEDFAGTPANVAVQGEALLRRAARLIEQGVFALPAFQPGVGPYPHAAAHWSARPDDPLDRRAAASLYLALMADASLDLIGSRERLIVEGRFADDATFVRALAALRPAQPVFVAGMTDNVPLGALHLVHPKLQPCGSLTAVQPLPNDLTGYARQWRSLAERPASARRAHA